MLLSLVAHAGAYRMMVGARNTIECQMHVGGCVVFFGYARRRRRLHCLIPGGMQGVLPYSPGTVKAGAHNTVDAQRHVGEPYRMGVNGAHNTIGENVGAYNTAWVLSCQEGHRVLPGRCTGYGPWYCDLTCAPCLTFFVRFLVLTEQASPAGWPQLALTALVGKELVSRGSAYPRSETWVGVKKRCLVRPSGRRGRPVAG